MTVNQLIERLKWLAVDGYGEQEIESLNWGRYEKPRAIKSVRVYDPDIDPEDEPQPQDRKVVINLE